MVERLSKAGEIHEASIAGPGFINLTLEVLERVTGVLGIEVPERM